MGRNKITINKTMRKKKLGRPKMKRPVGRPKAKYIKKKKVVKKLKVGDIAYHYKDNTYGQVPVMYSANAWWMDQAKLERLIQAFKMDCTITESRFYAGITEDQWKYFKKINKDFYTFLKECTKAPLVKARSSVIASFPTRPEIAFKYIERRDKRFKEKNEVDVTLPNLVQNVFDPAILGGERNKDEDRKEEESEK